MDLRANALVARDSLRRRRLLAQAVSFGAIGVISTVAYAVLYLAFRAAMPAAAANALALVVTAIGNTAANRRLTFGVRGNESLARDHAAGLAAFGVALAITTGALAALHLVAPLAPHTVELAVLIVANTVATASRFVLLRAWIGGGLPSLPRRTDRSERLAR